VEKPIGLHLKAAERAAKAIESAGVISSVGYHFRYQASTVQAQNLLKSAPAVAMVAGRWWGGFPQTAWWRRRTQSGGQLHEQATHLIDLARYLIGDISKVYSVGARREAKAFPGSDVFDVSALTCEFANGAIGTFSATCLLHDVTEVDLQLIRKDELLDLRGNYLTLRRAGETTTYSHRNNPFLDENIAFIESVISGKRGEIKCSYSDALQTLRVTLAANQSLKSGKTVKV
jgi:myo-inositol 2-dehydrogenase / D-chiro-inositol 1-dehydrogenase